MSKKQHYSQEDLKAMFGSDDVVKNIETIRQQEEKVKASKPQGRRGRQKKIKLPTVVEVRSEDAFCLRTAIARIQFLMKVGKETKLANIVANGKTFNLRNEGHGKWVVETETRNTHGNKYDAVVAAAETACNEWKLKPMDDLLMKPASV